jgi:hypothetical protein
MTIESRQIFINFESLIVPMLDFARFKEIQEKNKNKFDENKKADIKANENYNKGQEVYYNLGASNNDHLIYHGITLENNPNDCYNIFLSFTDNTDDDLKDKRKEFFSKFFMYDSNHQDLM